MKKVHPKIPFDSETRLHISKALTGMFVILIMAVIFYPSWSGNSMFEKVFFWTMIFVINITCIMQLYVSRIFWLERE